MGHTEHAHTIMSEDGYTEHAHAIMSGDVHTEHAQTVLLAIDEYLLF